eukprot:7664378-Pyramimonas_sp.AAC.2
MQLRRPGGRQGSQYFSARAGLCEPGADAGSSSTEYHIDFSHYGSGFSDSDFDFDRCQFELEIGDAGRLCWWKHLFVRLGVL